MNPVPKDADYFHFRLLKSKLDCCVNLRPDISCAVIFLIQIAEKTFTGQKAIGEDH